MSAVIAGEELWELVAAGVIDAPLAQVGAASVDITLGYTLYRESHPRHDNVVDLAAGQTPGMEEHRILDFGYLLAPGEFVLAHAVERFDLPDDVCALYALPSTLARCGLEHAAAGWIDPGFNGALTLELANFMQRHTLVLKPGMRCGQVIFFRCDEVPAELSYRHNGRYNGAAGVMPALGEGVR